MQNQSPVYELFLSVVSIERIQKWALKVNPSASWKKFLWQKLNISSKSIAEIFSLKTNIEIKFFKSASLTTRSWCNYLFISTFIPIAWYKQLAYWLCQSKFETILLMMEQAKIEHQNLSSKSIAEILTLHKNELA